MPAEKVISTLAGPDFAYHLQKTDELRSKEHTLLTDGEHEKLDAIVTLLGILSVFRQYYKTIALHQELAQLSRQFIFVAFPAVAVALLAPLVYETNPACAHPEPARPRNEYQSDDRHRPASARTGLYAPYRDDLPVHRHRRPVRSAGGMAVVPRTRLRGEKRRGKGYIPATRPSDDRLIETRRSRSRRPYLRYGWRTPVSSSARTRASTGSLPRDRPSDYGAR